MTPPPEQKAPCPVCQGTIFWLSIYGVRVCATCHPPLREEIVQEWIHLNEPS